MKNAKNALVARLFTCSVTTCAALVLLAAIGRAQTPAPVKDTEGGRPVLSVDEMVLEQYSVQHVNVDDLYDLGSRLLGRMYFLKERGGLASDAVPNLRVLGRSLILYDTQEQVKRILAQLAALDVPAKNASSPLQTSEYTPRFVSLDTLVSAVKPYVDRDDGTTATALMERGVLVLRAAPGRLEPVVEALKRIDVPEKQVLLTCQLIDVGATAQGPALPKELLDNLQRLLPQRTFSQVGLAILNVSIGAGRKISMSLESPNGQEYTLSLTPVAFDPATSSLTVENCSLVTRMPAPRELFSTDTILRGGEYTVLAATGVTPRLLVVQIAPLGK